MKSLALLLAGAVVLAGAPAASGYVVLTDEHVDVISIGYSPATGLSGRIHTDSGDYAPDEALVYDGPTGTTTIARPGGSQWDFLGVAAGEMLHFWPQSSLGNRIFPGIEAGSLTPTTFASRTTGDARAPGTARWLAVELVGVRYFDLAGNPGEAQFSLWQTSGPTPTVWMSTADGITAQDLFYVTAGGHAHANWGFSRAGYYQIDFRLSGQLAAGGQTVTSDVTTWHFGVEHQPVAIPEPGAFLLLALGLLAGGVSLQIRNRQPQP